MPPLAEQRRIVDRLDELLSDLDAGVAALERAKVLLGRYRQSVLRAAVTGELTRDWRERHAGQRESGADLLRRILAERRRRWEEAELAKLRAKGKTPRDDSWKRAYREPAAPDTRDLPPLPDGWAWSSFEALIADGPTNGYSPKTDRSAKGTPSLRLSATTSGRLVLNDATIKPLPELILKAQAYGFSLEIS